MTMNREGLMRPEGLVHPAERGSDQSSGRHTPGPWRVDGKLIFGPAQSLVAECFRLLTNDENANARRIVACVNACEGLPTEELERISKAAPFTGYASLKSINAELVEALKPFASIFDQKNPPDADYYEKKNSDHAWGFNDWTISWSAFKKARAALKKATS